jgi:hypothetical protein
MENRSKNMKRAFPVMNTFVAIALIILFADFARAAVQPTP